MVTQTSCPSVWKLRKWIRAWRKLLVLGSHGVACQDLHADRYQLNMHFLRENNQIQKMGKNWNAWNMLKLFWNLFSQRQIRVALSQICVREVISGTSKDQREVRQVRRTNRLQAQNPNFGHRKTIKLWIEWIIWIIWNYKLNFRTKWQKSQKSYFLCVARKVCPMHCSTLW